MKKDGIEVGTDLKLPTSEARRAIRLLWQTANEEKLEFKDAIIFLAMIFSLVSVITNFL